MRKFYLLTAMGLLCSLLMHAQVSLTGGAYTQDFNTLANSGTSSLLPAGWLLAESGTSATNNGLYAAGTGSGNAGDTYSFGAAASTERAFGGLLSGTLTPTIGGGFTNNTGGIITSLIVTYTGEQWRLGATGRTDRLDFQMSQDATSLITGTWTDVDALDFNAPNSAGTVGALDGNAVANRTNVSFTITGLSIANGATFYFRWNDANVTGADDGLGIDDFSITPVGAGGGTNLTINDVTAVEGNSGTTSFTFTVSLSAPAGAGGVTFDIATADNTASQPLDYTAASLTGQTIPAGNSTYTFTVLVNGDLFVEPNETFFVNVTNCVGATIVDGQGQGTITNDDVTCTPTMTIAQIQGSGVLSPVAGTIQTTSGIVTGVRSNGFFIQMPAPGDGNSATSDGIFVFTSSTPPPAAALGNNVCVTGTVSEFVPPSDPNSPAQTEFTSVSVTLLSTGNALPAPVILTTADTDPAGSFYQLEKYEGMRVQVPTLVVTGPTGGNVNEPNATATTDGYFYGVVSGVARPFREPGVQQPDPLPPGAPATVTRFDANPELLGINSTGLTGSTAIDVAAGATLTNVTGPLDFRFRLYTIDIDPGSAPVVSNNNLTYTAVPAANATEVTVASFNTERFFDTVNDPGVSDAVLTVTAFNNRLNKLSLAIRNVLNTPDILGVEEVENLTTLQAIATKVNNDAIAASQPNPNYVAYLVEGNDVGGIDVGFLVKSSKVNVISVTQYGLSATYIDPGTGTPALLNDRPPLVLNATVTRSGCTTPFPLTVIVNHLRSLNGVDDPVDGNRVRTKRNAQGEYLANLIQGFQTADPTANIISVGDYNAFEFSDGYADVMGAIKGTPVPASQVVLASATITNPPLSDLVQSHTPAQRYSYNFGGNAQVLDHILVNNNAQAKLSRFNIARLDADFPEIIRNDPNRPERISDHDAPVAYFTIPSDNIPPVITCPANVVVSNTPGQCGAIVNYPAVIATDNCAGVTVTSVPAAGSFFPKGITTVIATATDASGNTSNCSFTVTVNDTQAPTITCPANIITTTTAGQCGAIVNFPSPVINDNCPFPTGATVNLQQTASNSITTGNSVSCNSGGIHTDNSYYRIYDLSTLSLTGPLTINNVSFGVEQANAPSGSQPVTVKLYTLTGSFTLANLTAVGSQTFSVPNQAGTVFTGTLTTPVTVGPTAKLVIELFTPAGAGTGSSFFIGSNTSAETGPSYLLATACGVSSPVTVSSIGFPNMHIVLNASGTLPAASAVVSVPASGSFFPKGTTTVNSTVTDAAGNTATCSFTVTVNDNIAPAITCPANITVSTPVGSCTATVNYTVTATDNCPGVTTALVSGLASGSAFPLGVTTVTHRATDLAGNQTNCSFTVTVNDGQLPVITTQPAATITACATDNVNVSVVATNAQSYQWQQYNGTAWVNIAGATAATLPLPNATLALNTTTYRCQVIGRCTTIISGTSTVYINPLPTVTLVASNPPALLPGQSTTITAVVNPSGGSFAWFKNGTRMNGVSGSALTGLTVDDIGTYKVTYTDGNGCKQTSADLAVTAETSSRLYVYPNPNTGRFQVRINNVPNEDLYVTVYDSKGTKVYQKKVTTSAVSYSRLDVDLGLKASGVFIVELRDASGKQVASRPILVLQR